MCKPNLHKIHIYIRNYKNKKVKILLLVNHNIFSIYDEIEVASQVNLQVWHILVNLILKCMYLRDFLVVCWESLSSLLGR